jgi:hypothetical protein
MVAECTLPRLGTTQTPPSYNSPFILERISFSELAGVMSGRTLLQNATLCVPRPSIAANSKTGLNLTDSVVVRSTVDPGRLPESHVVIRVDRFGFSANNVSYQALGEHPHFR